MFIVFCLIIIFLGNIHSTLFTVYNGDDNKNISYLFLHIHKAGGTSLITHLRKVLQNTSFAQTEGTYSIVYDKKYFAYKPPVFTFLRNPLDQVISSYQYQFESYGPKYLSKRNYTMLSNIDECMNTSTCAEFYANKQSREVNEENFDLPKKFWFVGIFEYFDASLCMLRYKLGYYPDKLCDCKCRYKMKENIGTRDFKVSHHLNASVISNTTLALIRKYTQLDQKLYKIGLDYFHSEVKTLGKISGIDFLCLNENSSLLINGSSSNTDPVNHIKPTRKLDRYCTMPKEEYNLSKPIIYDSKTKKNKIAINDL